MAVDPVRVLQKVDHQGDVMLEPGAGPPRHSAVAVADGCVAADWQLSMVPSSVGREGFNGSGAPSSHYQGQSCLRDVEHHSSNRARESQPTKQCPWLLRLSRSRRILPQNLSPKKGQNGANEFYRHCSVSDGPMKISVSLRGTRGVRARYDAVVPPFNSFVRSPGRPVILVPDSGVQGLSFRGDLQAQYHENMMRMSCRLSS